MVQCGQDGLREKAEETILDVGKGDVNHECKQEAGAAYPPESGGVEEYSNVCTIPVVSVSLDATVLYPKPGSVP